MIFGNIWGTERRRGVTAGDKSYLIRVSRGKCEYCGKAIISKGITPNIHHIVEHASRGSSQYHNLIVLCPDCHSIVHGVGITKEKLRAKIAYRLKKNTSTVNSVDQVPTGAKDPAKKVAARKATTKKDTPKKTTAKTATKGASTENATSKKATTKTATTKAAAKSTTTRKTATKRSPSRTS